MLVKLDVLLLACGLQVVTILVIAWQWKRLAGIIKVRVGFLNVLHINMVGTFVESVTPAVKAGGEAVKAIMLKSKLGMTSGEAVAVVGVQKVVSIVPLMVLVAISLIQYLFNHGVMGLQGKVILASFAVVLVAVAFLVGALYYPRWTKRVVNRFTPGKYKTKIAEMVDQFQQSIQKIKSSRGELLFNLALSFFIWSFFPLKAYIVAIALGIDVGFWNLAAVIYLAYIVAMVPLTPGGLGTFEATVAFLLMPLSISFATAMAFAILIRFITYWFVFASSTLFVASAWMTKELKTKCSF